MVAAADEAKRRGVATRSEPKCGGVRGRWVFFEILPAPDFFIFSPAVSRQLVQIGTGRGRFCGRWRRANYKSRSNRSSVFVLLLKSRVRSRKGRFGLLLRFLAFGFCGGQMGLSVTQWLLLFG